ncbi:ABC transporter substrate-binding protein [Brasilonema sp. UFV-L1]|uniref:ABC transporter substrate-binding protein n=1 Tax=Brasilonema sp. UFV-L1 TaxID=2234130 RepID=UPI00145D9018|nr:ABC transporter substrate-binding protein [Brasilonema sp. UFV-L1]NMG07934.1 carbohydrate ABC transporter substrate-binding protein [Brasilonema sp. UFV-L1]
MDKFYLAAKYNTVVSRRTSYRLKLSLCYAFIGLLVSLIVVACGDSKTTLSPVNDSSTKNTVLKIWWDKGYTLEEDEALQQVVNRWEQQTGNKVKLSLYTSDELSQKALRAIQAGNPPDIVMNDNGDRLLSPRLAWEGKLANVSDVIEPIKHLYPETILKSVYFYNNLEKQRSYYAIPIHQGIPHIFYWRDLLKLAGKSEKDIPKDWDAFWEFWKQVQDSLWTQQNQKIYGIGFPMSIGAVDTYEIFEQILEAYEVQLLDSQGQLRVDNPKVRQGIIDCIDWYTKFYRQGYVPPEAVNWLNPDNNRQLLNRFVVMTPNNSLSIPGAVRQNFDTYHNKLGTIGYPNKPNGKPMHYLALVKQAVVLADSKNQKLAKKFLAYFIQPEITGNYLKVAGGRFSPVHKLVWKDPFWTNPKDPHIWAVSKPITLGQTRLFYTAQNPAYSIVVKENIWGKALNKVVVNKIYPQQAADEAIAHIKQIFEQWK